VSLPAALAGEASANARVSAEPAPSARLSAAFTPERLGAPTTVSFAVSIEPPAATGPIPLSAVAVSYPSTLGLATSGLGLSTCEPAALAVVGAAACPADSKMGSGSALVEVPFGPALVKEHVSLSLYAAPSSDGYVHLAILAYGREPVLALVVLAGVLHPGRLDISVPPIASLPGAPYVALVSMHASLGGALTYYERVRGRTVAYRPRGIGLPSSCPRGGWKLAAGFRFTNGQSTRARTAIPCPPSRRG
jgi:hypothetical protein